MRIRMEPNKGQHEIVVDPIVLRTPDQVDQQIRYLQTLKHMLWLEEEKNAEVEDAHEEALKECP